MDYGLEKYTHTELKKMCEKMDILYKKDKDSTISEISKWFLYYEQYINKQKKRYKFVDETDIKENTVVERDGNKYIKKQYKMSKSISSLEREYKYMTDMYKLGICIKPIECDVISRYIIIEYYEGINPSFFKKKHQLRILDIYKELDKHNIFYNNTSLNSICIKNDKVYLTDFSNSKHIRKKSSEKLTNIKDTKKYLIKELKKYTKSNCYKYL